MPKLVQEFKSALDEQNAPVFDEFHLGPVFDESGKDWAKSRGVYNQDNEQIAIVSDKYTLVNHSDVYRWTKRVLESNGLPVEGNVVFTENQGRMYLNLDTRFDLDTGVVPEEMPNAVDMLKVGLTVVNSVDGTAGLKVMVRLERCWCSNGMYAGVPHENHDTRTRHIGIVAFEPFVDAFDRALNYVTQIPALAQAGHRTPLTHDEATRLVEKYLNLPKVYVKRVTDRIRNRVEDKTTAWTLYNDLTFAITRKSEEKHISQNRLHDLHAEANKILLAAFSNNLMEIVALCYDDDEKPPVEVPEYLPENEVDPSVSVPEVFVAREPERAPSDHSPEVAETSETSPEPENITVEDLDADFDEKEDFNDFDDLSVEDFDPDEPDEPLCTCGHPKESHDRNGKGKCLRCLGCLKYEPDTKPEPEPEPVAEVRTITTPAKKPEEVGFQTAKEYSNHNHYMI